MATKKKAADDGTPAAEKPAKAPKTSKKKPQTADGPNGLSAVENTILTALGSSLSAEGCTVQQAQQLISWSSDNADAVLTGLESKGLVHRIGAAFHLVPKDGAALTPPSGSATPSTTAAAVATTVTDQPPWQSGEAMTNQQTPQMPQLTPEQIAQYHAQMAAQQQQQAQQQQPQVQQQQQPTPSTPVYTAPPPQQPPPQMSGEVLPTEPSAFVEFAENQKLRTSIEALTVALHQCTAALVAHGAGNGAQASYGPPPAPAGSFPMPGGGPPPPAPSMGPPMMGLPGMNPGAMPGQMPQMQGPPGSMPMMGPGMGGPPQMQQTMMGPPPMMGGPQMQMGMPQMQGMPMMPQMQQQPMQQPMQPQMMQMPNGMGMPQQMQMPQMPQQQMQGMNPGWPNGQPPPGPPGFQPK